MTDITTVSIKDLGYYGLKATQPIKVSISEDPSGGYTAQVENHNLWETGATVEEALTKVKESIYQEAICQGTPEQPFLGEVAFRNDYMDLLRQWQAERPHHSVLAQRQEAWDEEQDAIAEKECRNVRRRNGVGNTLPPRKVSQKARAESLYEARRQKGAQQDPGLAEYLGIPIV